MKSISLFLVLLYSMISLGTSKLLCRAYYHDFESIEFGMFFQQAKDIETIEALNKMSKSNLFTAGEANPEIMINHMIDTLLFYRALQEAEHIHGIPPEFQNFDIQFFYSSIEAETLGKNKKFNYFKPYIELGF